MIRFNVAYDANSRRTSDRPGGSSTQSEGQGRRRTSRLAQVRGGVAPSVGDLVRRVPGSRRVWDRIKYGTPLRMSPVSVTQPSDRGEPTTDREVVLARYRASKVTKELDNFVLYRIIGNDLPPRHEVGQARKNLDFILEHEPDFPGCEKRFLVNRVVDTDEEERIVDMLEQAGAIYIRVPFSWEEYRQVPPDTAGVPERYYPTSERYQWLREDQKERCEARLYRYKNNYAMNNNGARNVALEDGRTAAKWVMPWDGNCFLTTSAYEELRASIRGRPEVPYWLVRMVRLDDNAQALEGDIFSWALEEPQIVFRRDAAMSFDLDFPYGRRPKVELLWRLGVPGPWDEWGVEPWDLPCPHYGADVGAFEWTSWVVRLAAASAESGDGLGAARERTWARRRAIVNFLKALDDHSKHSG